MFTNYGLRTNEILFEQGALWGGGGWECPEYSVFILFHAASFTSNIFRSTFDPGFNISFTSPKEFIYTQFRSLISQRHFACYVASFIREKKTSLRSTADSTYVIRAVATLTSSFFFFQAQFHVSWFLKWLIPFWKPQSVWNAEEFLRTKWA